MTNDDKDNIDKDKALKFPCDFPIKVIGNANDSFEAAVLTIVRKHVPDIREGAIKFNSSKQGKYLAITLVIQATSQTQLDAIFQELSAHEQVVMVI